MGSGLVPLRPLTIGEIYDGSIRAIRAHPQAMAGFAAVVVAIFSLITLLPQAAALSRLAETGVFDENFSETAELSDATSALGTASVTLLLATLQYLVGTAVVSCLAVVGVDAAIRGASMTPSSLLARARPRMLPAVGLSFVILILILIISFACILPGALLAYGSADSAVGGLLAGIGAIAAVVLGMTLVFARWAIAVPVLVLEQRGIFSSLRRSNQLVKGSSWRVLGITLLSAVLVSILWRIFLVPFGIFAELAGPQVGTGSFGQTVVQLLITNIGTIVAGAILFPFSSGVLALLHLDLRIRREGLDVDLLRPDQPR